MMTISLVNPKGGCGKSTLAMNLGVLLARSLRVALIDSDPQKTLIQWSQLRSGKPPEVLTASGQEINRLLFRIKGSQQIDACLVDTQGSLSGLSMALAVDLVIVPVQASMSDMFEVRKLLLGSTEAKAELRLLAYRTKTLRDREILPSALEAITEQIGYGKVLHSAVADRVSYRASMMDSGAAAVEIDPKANQEITAVATELGLLEAS